MPRELLPRLHLNFALLVGRLSTCSRLKVGCVLTDPTMEQVVGFGYNGNAAGLPNRCEREEPGNCGCVHAEVNAVMKAGRGEKLAFTTAAPCPACAKAYINAGITTIFYLPGYRLEDEGLKILALGGVKFQGISEIKAQWPFMGFEPV